MKFAYTYRQSIAFALYMTLLTGIAAPAMARPVSGNAALSAVAASAVAQTPRPKPALKREPTKRTGFVTPRKNNADEASGKLVPDGVTLRSTAGVKGFERTRVQVGGANGVNVQEQVVDITNFDTRTRTPGVITSSPLSDEIDPYWSPDEQFIFFASNRDVFGTPDSGTADSFDGTPDNYQLYRIASNPSPGAAGQLARLTNEPGAIHRFPTVSASNRLAFIKSVAGSTDFQLYSAAVPPGALPNTATAQIPAATVSPAIASLTAGRQVGGRNILRVGRPAWLTGTEIVFSADLSDGQSDVLVVNVQSGFIRALTNSLASEANVAVSPDGGVVAFDSNASGYNVAAPAASTGIAANNVRNVFVVSSIGTDAVQVTGGTGSGVGTGVSSVQPAWSRSSVTPFFGTESRSFLAFASNRQPGVGGAGFVATANGSKDIYYLAALTQNVNGAPGLLIEGTNFPAGPTPTYASVATGSIIKLDTGDLQANNSYRWDDSYPTFPPLLNALR
ncbi:MAG: PD40 domain-containing protein, partial [Armatimonadetes bacterium]|nr:PD40 domain-containing protein [Armatimonadota bacterium]